MINRRALAVGALALVLSPHALHSQDRARYRNFQLGRDLPSIAALTGVAASEARTIHLRPAMMQELRWQRPYFVSGATPAQPDAVKQIVFSFYNDQLSKMVVDYDHDRTAGMTDADLIAALSTEYGTPVKPAVRTGRGVPPPGESESGTLVASWGDAEYSVVLYRSLYLAGVRVMVTSTRLDALARAADAQATKLDEREAPMREIARQKKEADERAEAEAKARAANKAAFRP